MSFESSQDCYLFADARIQNPLSPGYGEWEFFSHNISEQATIGVLQESHAGIKLTEYLWKTRSKQITFILCFAYQVTGKSIPT